MLKRNDDSPGESQFSRDRVHFNSEGAKVYADKLACHVINFQLPGINVRR